ncbi:hypothetical protein RDV60_05860 [Porphyromonas gingivalis]|uniref:Uncharacterized protein n=1 Tax=Porphyromonas gingivalis TaxID=837 RepID=A0AAF0BD59_PORGN|nr:hypothetical protein [Porphyromonas gingivalis]MDR4976145.1 hypothetical protein [Porphyromonas gingivalis]WCG00112.1 hypothetical protein NY149_01685 [Porphyromonas gingivalis]
MFFARVFRISGTTFF